MITGKNSISKAYIFYAAFLVGLAACYPIRNEDFGYTTREHSILHTEEYGDIDVYVLHQHDDTVGNVYNAGYVAANIYGTALRLEQLGFGPFEDINNWTVYVVDDRSSQWHDICGDYPNDLFTIVGCSYFEWGLFPMQHMFTENQIAIVDYAWQNWRGAQDVICHEARHMLSYRYNGDLDGDHDNAALWSECASPLAF